MEHWIWWDWATTNILAYGAPALGLVLFLGAIGLPIPGTLLVFAAGALVQQEVLNGPHALVTAWAGVVLGDHLSYALGRVAGQRILARFAHIDTWQRARTAFARQGGLLIYLTRFLLTPLAIPVNLVAGSSGYSFWRFLRNDLAGELTWLLLYGGTGYAVGNRWEALAPQVESAGLLLPVIALLVLGLLLLAPLFLKQHTPDFPCITPCP